MELSHCSNASIFPPEILKVLFDNGSNDLVFVSIFSLGLLQVLFDCGINESVFVICVLLKLLYLGLDLGYLLGLNFLCLKKIHFLHENLCCGELLIWNSNSRVILVTSWILRYQWCCIWHMSSINLGNGGLLILNRLCPPKLFLLLDRYPLLMFGGKEFSPPISYPGQRCK